MKRKTKKLTMKGWVSVNKNGRVRCNRSVRGDYCEIPFFATRKRARQLWMGTPRRATLTIDAGEKP
jgi:hypothetical protein